MTSVEEGLSCGQRDLLDVWLPGAQVTADHSWGLVGTTVLELVHEGERYIVKAGDERDHHLAREITAHWQWLRPWRSPQRAPELVQADIKAKLLLTRFLEGELVEGSPLEWDRETYRQAGELLALLHAQSTTEDVDYEATANRRALKWLDSEHRIPAAVASRLREEIAAWPTPCVMVVPTHGDWQPRNWLSHNGEVRVIDFGRAALRPALTDFARLAVQQFQRSPDLETAFIEGYGSDPREPGAWRRNQICEAIGTAVWAYQVGDVAFEQQGHRMIAEALEGL